MRLVRRLSFTSLFSLLLGGVIHRFGGTVEGLNFLESSKSSEEDIFEIKKPLELRDADISDVEQELDEETKTDLENVDLKNETGLVLLNKTNLPIEDIAEEIPSFGSNIENTDIESSAEPVQEQSDNDLTVVIVADENSSGGTVLEKITFEEQQAEQTEGASLEQEKSVEVIKAIVVEGINIDNSESEENLKQSQGTADELSNSVVSTTIATVVTEIKEAESKVNDQESSGSQKSSLVSLESPVDESQQKSELSVRESVAETKNEPEDSRIVAVVSIEESKQNLEPKQPKIDASNSGDPSKAVVGRSSGNLNSKNPVRRTTKGGVALVTRKPSRGSVRSLRVVGRFRVQ